MIPVSKFATELISKSKCTDMSIDGIQGLLEQNIKKIEAEVAKLEKEIKRKLAGINLLKSDVQLLKDSKAPPNAPVKRAGKWRLTPTLTQMVMDYDYDWSINFWLLSKKLSSHGSLRRSVAMCVYDIVVNEDDLTPPLQQFLRHNLSIPTPIITATKDFRYKSTDVDGHFNTHYYDKTVTVQIPTSAIELYRQSEARKAVQLPKFLGESCKAKGGIVSLSVRAGLSISDEGDIYDPELPEDSEEAYGNSDCMTSIDCIQVVRILFMQAFIWNCDSGNLINERSRNKCFSIRYQGNPIVQSDDDIFKAVQNTPEFNTGKVLMDKTVARRLSRAGVQVTFTTVRLCNGTAEMEMLPVRVLESIMDPITGHIHVAGYTHEQGSGYRFEKCSDWWNNRHKSSAEIIIAQAKARLSSLTANIPPWTHIEPRFQYIIMCRVCRLEYCHPSSHVCMKRR